MIPDNQLSAIMRKTGMHVTDFQRRKSKIRATGEDLSPKAWPTALIICPKFLIRNVSATEHTSLMSSGSENSTLYVGSSDSMTLIFSSGDTSRLLFGRQMTGFRRRLLSVVDILTSVRSPHLLRLR